MFVHLGSHEDVRVYPMHERCGRGAMSGPPSAQLSTAQTGPL